MNDISVSIVVPAYNEENLIRENIAKIKEFFKNRGLSYEIIVVDDGSKDNTRSIIKAFIKECENVRLIENIINKGKGYSVKKGVLTSRGKIIFITDADLSGFLGCFDEMFKKIEEGYDIVIGSRYSAGAIVKNRSKFRNFSGKIFNIILKVLKLTNFNDTQCGFKLLKGDVAKKIYSLINILGYAFDVEVLYLAKKKGYKIIEVPIVWEEKGGSNVSIIKDSLIMLKDILFLFFRAKKIT